MLRGKREHHLNTVKLGAEVQNENRVISIARTRLTKTLCALLSIYSRLPKLDVAGSIPVSRSMFSITWEEPKNTRYSVYSVFFPTLA
jgi:hypothetical protein